MLQPQRPGAQPVPLAIVVGAQKLASGSSARARGDNVKPVSSLDTESWWVHGGLDYMHARFCSPVTGRFLGIDPKALRRATNQPQAWNRYSYAQGNPLRFVDPDGQDERVGWEAGSIQNNSGMTIYIAADVAGQGVVVIPLDTGENSSSFVEDADAIIVAPGQTVDGEKEGAFKVGSTDVVVENGAKDGSVEIDAPNGEWMINSMAGRAGHESQQMADGQGWKAPQTAEDKQKAREKKEELRAKRQEKKRSEQQAPKPEAQ